MEFDQFSHGSLSISEYISRFDILYNSLHKCGNVALPEEILGLLVIMKSMDVRMVVTKIMLSHIQIVRENQTVEIDEQNASSDHNQGDYHIDGDMSRNQVDSPDITHETHKDYENVSWKEDTTERLYIVQRKWYRFLYMWSSCE